MTELVSTQDWTTTVQFIKEAHFVVYNKSGHLQLVTNMIYRLTCVQLAQQVHLCNPVFL